jgi:hypothetical protein
MPRDFVAPTPVFSDEREKPPSPPTLNAAEIADHTDLSESEVKDELAVDDKEKETPGEGKESEAQFVAEIVPHLEHTLRKLTIESQENPDKPNEKINKTLKYFLTETEHSTLEGEKIKQTPVERIANRYFPLLEGETDPGKIAEIKENISLHASEVVALAFRQQLDNPEKYVSHGFDHTLNVAGQAEKIVESNPEVLEAIKKKYGLNDEQAKFANTLVAWFHDFGYPAVGERDKAAHAITGADIIDSPRIRGLHRQLLGGEEVNTDLLLADLKDSVLFHGADKVERSFDAKFTTTHGEYLVDSQNVIEIFSKISNDPGVEGEQNNLLQIFVNSEESKIELETALQEAIVEYGLKTKIPEIIVEDKEYMGRSADFSTAKDKLIGLEYKPVDVMSSPLHAIVRLADNVDMTEARFSELQREPAFREVYHLLGDTTQRFGNLTVFLEGVSEDDMDGALLKVSQAIDYEKGVIDYKKKDGVNVNADAEAISTFAERVSAVNNPEELLVAWKKFIVEKTLIENPPSDQTLIGDLVKLTIEQNSQALRHFGGCEAVKEVNLVGNQLLVTVDQEKYEALNKIRVYETTKLGDTINESNVGVGEYQIWRARQAYESITFNGDIIEVVVKTQTKDNQKDVK